MNINLQKVASSEVREQYCSRARDHFHRDAQVLDFGMYAGETVNACFWLTLAAGLGKSAWQINTQTQPGLADSVELLQQVRAMPLDSLDFLVNYNGDFFVDFFRPWRDKKLLLVLKKYLLFMKTYHFAKE